MFISGMYFENGFATVEIRCIDKDLAVKAAGAKKRPVENLGPIGGRKDNNTGVGFEAIHLHQQSIESLFALVVDRAHMDTPLSADSIKLVDEYDAGRMFLGLFEEIADPSCTYSHKHFYEIAATDQKERYFRLARYCAR